MSFSPPVLAPMLWFDFETGGLDPEKQDLTEIAFSMTDRNGNTQWDWHGKVQPRLPVLPEAAKINGYTPEKWTNAYTLEEAATLIKRCAEPFQQGLMIPSGWQIPFDLAFYRKHLQGLLPFKLHYHAFDLMAYAWEHVEFQNKPHLRDLATALRITPGEEHTAGGDVYTYLECYRELRRRTGILRGKQASATW